MGEQASRTAFGRRQATVGFPDHFVTRRRRPARSRRDRGGARQRRRPGQLGELRFTRNAVAWDFAIFSTALSAKNKKLEMKNRVLLEAPSEPLI
jgi:hypothetical protein